MVCQIVARSSHNVVAWGGIACILLAGSSRQSWAQDSVEQHQPFRLGHFSQQVVAFNKPSAVTISQAGEVFLSDTLNRRIAVMDRHGSMLRSFGQDILREPAGIVIDDHMPRRVWVTDGDRIVRFTPGGQLLDQIMAQGDVGFGQLTGIAADAGGVIVTDCRTNQVHRLDADGRVLSSFGGFGSDDGQFNHPMDVAVDAGGCIYIADADNNRICKFDRAGRFTTAWGQWGPFPGLFDRPTGVTARDGRIFVADQQNHRVQVFTSDGVLVYRWGVHALLPREGEGKLHYPADMAIDPRGEFAVICEPFENRVQVFDVAADDVTEAQLNTPPAPLAQQTHFGRFLDVDGNLLAMGEPESHTVYVFRIDQVLPVIITQFGMQGSQPGRFARMGPMHIDAHAKRLWVADQATRVVQMFSLADLDNTGEVRMQPFASRFVWSVDLGRMLHDGQGPIDPVAIDVDQRGRLFVIDAVRNSVVVFDPRTRDAHVLCSFSDSVRLRDISSDASANRVWLLDTAQTSIIELDMSTGAQVSRIGIARIREPAGMTREQTGAWLVSDEATGGVYRVTPDDTREVFTRFGSGIGELWHPGQLRVDTDGRFFVADRGNHRGQIFDGDGRCRVIFGIGRGRVVGSPAEDDQ